MTFIKYSTQQLQYSHSKMKQNCFIEIIETEKWNQNRWNKLEKKSAILLMKIYLYKKVHYM
jgi:hypothetical protein